MSKRKSPHGIRHQKFHGARKCKSGKKLKPLDESSWFRWHIMGQHDVRWAHFRVETSFALHEEREKLGYSLVGEEVVEGE